MRWIGFLMLLNLLALPALAADAPVWRTDRPHKAVVIGGSISKYFAGNFGQFLEHGCSKLEVLNRGEVGAGGAKLLRNLQREVLDKPAVLRPMQGGKGWILFQGGLNSVAQVRGTMQRLAELFSLAHSADLRVLALSLTPWGADSDARFAGWKGLQLHQATAEVSRFLTGKPAADSGFVADQLPDIGIDLWNSELRDAQAPLRAAAPLEASFASSPYRKDTQRKGEWVAAARAVPRHYLAAAYRGFDHTHPGTAGHRLMAALACQQAPAEWQCDCDAIRRARWKGKVVGG